MFEQVQIEYNDTTQNGNDTTECCPRSENGVHVGEVKWT